jgi:hypothetical protein
MTAALNVYFLPIILLFGLPTENFLLSTVQILRLNCSNIILDSERYKKVLILH